MNKKTKAAKKKHHKRVKTIKAQIRARRAKAKGSKPEAAR